MLIHVSFASWESEKDKTLNNNNDVFETNMMLLNHIKPIEIWEQLHQLMSRDTILQAKSPEAPGATTRWSSTPDGIFDQVAWRTGGFTGVLRLIYVGSISLCRWYVDEGCHDVLQAYCLLNFKDVILQCSKSGVVQVHGGYAEPSTDSGYFP